jgi:predicted transposase/invertase (TIGR01784 family)
VQSARRSRGHSGGIGGCNGIIRQASGQSARRLLLCLLLVHRLKPTSDLVFKLLLQKDPNLVLLRSMLDCVLELTSPIEDIEILNPDIEKDYPVDKPISLDVRVHLKNLTRVDIEMQAEVTARTASRFLYYWARDFGLGLKRGDDYSLLVPVTSVIWLGENLLQSQQFHSIFHLSEDTTREHFSNDIEVHTLELRKLHLLSGSDHPKLYRWSRFLVTDSEQELVLLAKEDPIMDTAKKTLEELSADPEIRARAYERETALRAHHHTIAAERAEGEARGLAKGRVEGRVEGLREMLARLLAKRFGELPPWAADRVAQAQAEQLEIYLEAVLTASSLETALQLNA